MSGSEITLTIGSGSDSEIVEVPIASWDLSIGRGPGTLSLRSSPPFRFGDVVAFRKVATKFMVLSESHGFCDVMMLDEPYGVFCNQNMTGWEVVE